MIDSSNMSDEEKQRWAAAVAPHAFARTPVSGPVGPTQCGVDLIAAARAAHAAMEAGRGMQAAPAATAAPAPELARGPAAPPIQGELWPGGSRMGRASRAALRALGSSGSGAERPEWAAELALQAFRGADSELPTMALGEATLARAEQLGRTFLAGRAFLADMLVRMEAICADIRRMLGE